MYQTFWLRSDISGRTLLVAWHCCYVSICDCRNLWRCRSLWLKASQFMTGVAICDGSLHNTILSILCIFQCYLTHSWGSFWNLMFGKLYTIYMIYNATPSQIATITNRYVAPTSLRGQDIGRHNADFVGYACWSFPWRSHSNACVISRLCSDVSCVPWRLRPIKVASMASPITSPTIVYSTVYSGADQRKRQSSTSLAFEFTGDRWIPCTNGQ